jgi:hypothetical protein
LFDQIVAKGQVKCCLPSSFSHQQHELWPGGLIGLVNVCALKHTDWLDPATAFDQRAFPQADP